MFPDVLVSKGPSLSKMREDAERLDRAEREMARIKHKVTLYRDFIREETAAKESVQKQLEAGRDIETSQRLKGPDAAKLLSLLAGYEWTIACANTSLERWLKEVETAKEKVERVRAAQYEPSPVSVRSKDADSNLIGLDMAALAEALQPGIESQRAWAEKHGAPEPMLRSGRW